MSGGGPGALPDDAGGAGGGGVGTGWSGLLGDVDLATGVAAACAALALGLLWRPVPRRPGRGPRGRARWPLLSGVAAALAVVAVVQSPRLVALSAIGVATAVAGVRLWRRRVTTRRATRTRAFLVETCEAISAELAAGLAPADALGRAARDWPLLETAARTAATGGSVPDALRAESVVAGAADLRVAAAAWQVASRTGHGLADALDRVATDLRAADRTRRVVVGELASARATARLVAVLPAVALLMGSTTGADPWAFLFGEPLGLVCLAAGLSCAVAGLAWIEAIATGVERGR